MKSKNFSKKLTLKKATIADLNKSEMNAVYGGDIYSKRMTQCNCPTITSRPACC